MRVIVNVSGFFGGTWFSEKKEPQEMPDAIARAFLPPLGDQLSLPAAKKVDRTAPTADEKKAV